MTTGSGAGGGSLIPPGDPGGLRQAAANLSAAAGALDSTSGSVRSTAVPTANWSGTAAANAAERIEALGAAYVVASDALFGASQIMNTYANQLEQAQNMGRQALTAMDTWQSLNQVVANTPAPSPNSPPTFSEGAEQVERPDLIQQAKDAHSQYLKLASNAQQLAAQAAQTAATGFHNIAAMAGSAKYHGSSDPFEALLGVASPVDAAMLAVSATNLVGIDAAADKDLDGDQTLLTDLQSDPAANLSSLTLLRSRIKVDTTAAAAIPGFKRYLQQHKVPLPPGLDNLDPVAQAALLGALVTLASKVKKVPGWEKDLTVGLKSGSALLATGGVITAFASLLLPPGADVAGEGIGASEDLAAAGTGVLADDLEGLAAREALSNAEKGLTKEGAKNLARVLDYSSVGFGAGALGVDAGSVLSGQTNADPMTFIFDGLSVVGGGGVVVTDLRAATITDDLAAAKLAGDTKLLKLLESKETVNETIRGLISSKTSAVGAGGGAYAWLQLGVPASPAAG